MDKKTAEQLLGLNGAYDYKDMTKAYREQVKKNHPDTGGTPEAMIQVNKAKEFMEKQFRSNRNAIFSTDTTPYTQYSNNPYKKNTYTPPPTRTTPTWQPTKTAEQRDAEARQRQEDKKKRAEAAKAAHERSKQTSSSSASSSTSSTKLWSDYIYGTPEPEAEVTWWEKAYGASSTEVENNGPCDSLDEIIDGAIGKSKYSKPEGKTPVWYTILNALVNHFPWRIAVLLIGVFFTINSNILVNLTDEGVGTLLWLLIMGGALLNLVTGCFTNPIRKSIFNMMNVALRKHNAGNNSDTKAEE